MNPEVFGGLSRADFLRVTALGAEAGLAATPESSQPRAGYVVTVTHGPSDPSRVMLALFTATRLPDGDNHVWFAIQAGQLCKKGEAEKITSPLFTKQGNAAKLLDTIRAQKTKIHI